MIEAEYNIVKELPSIRHKYKVGQEVLIVHGTMAVKAEISEIRISLRDEEKKVIYLFDELRSPQGAVGREEKDVFELKQDLVDAIFEL